MKVCHIMSGDLWAGAEVMNFHLLKGLAEIPGVELRAIVLNEGKLADSLRTEGIGVRVIEEGTRSFLRLSMEVRDAVREDRPDILHSHRVKENILAVLSVFPGKDAALVCTQHGLPEPAATRYKSVKKSVIGRVHDTILKSRFRRVIAVSEEMVPALARNFGARGDMVVHIPNGTALPAFVRRKDGGTPFVIGSAGRFFPVKDYRLMIEVARAVRERRHGVEFRLAGDGPEKEALLRSVEEYGLEDGFRFTGFVEDMETFYRELDLYINTSIHEGLPMSVLEAMARGIPVVAPACGGFPELLEDGEQGFLVTGRDPSDFAERCLRLCDDRVLLERMGNACRRRVEETYSMGRMAERYYEMYREVTS